MSNLFLTMMIISVQQLQFMGKLYVMGPNTSLYYQTVEEITDPTDVGQQSLEVVSPDLSSGAKLYMVTQVIQKHLFLNFLAYPRRQTFQD